MPNVETRTYSPLGYLIEFDQGVSGGNVFVSPDREKVRNAHDVKAEYPQGGTITLEIRGIIPQLQKFAVFENPVILNVKMVEFNQGKDAFGQTSSDIDGNFYLRGKWQIFNIQVSSEGKTTVIFKKIQ